MYNFSIAAKISKVKSQCASESINSWVCTNPVVSVKKLQVTSLVVQWLRLHSQCRDPCSNAGQIQHDTTKIWYSQINIFKKKKKLQDSQEP